MRKVCLLFLASLVALSLAADEGMWLFNRPPRALLKQRYNFEPSQAWLDHLQKSSVRFNSGGSGSFVSSDGLLLTNHHVGLDTLEKLSSKGKDYVKSGFFAKSRQEEVPAVDLVFNEKTLKGSFYGSTRPQADMPKLLNLYRAGKLPLDKFISRRYPLDQINEAYQAMLSGEVARSVLVPS